MEWYDNEIESLGWRSKRRWTGDEWAALAFAMGIIMMTAKVLVQMWWQ